MQNSTASGDEQVERKGASLVEDLSESERSRRWRTNVRKGPEESDSDFFLWEEARLGFRV